MKTKNALFSLGLMALLSAGSILGAAAADALSAAEQSKVEAKLKQIQAWAAEPVIVEAVKAHNAGVSAESAAMTQEKWKTLSVLDPWVRAFSKNPAADFLKSRKDEVVTEAFLSGADGAKVAFLSKTTYWSHHGKEKHELPMSGKTWQGPVETDESTGARQLQVSVPVLDAGKPVGSLVVGLSAAKLE